MSRHVRAFALAALLSAFARPASADHDPDHSILDTHAPPTLPALARPDLVYRHEVTGARLVPTGAGLDGAYAWSAHASLEIPISPRRWYLGFAHAIAAASLPGRGNAVWAGSPELWLRGLFSSSRGLSAGGGLGVVVPLPRGGTGDLEAILQTARLVRPWDLAHFEDRALTLRPWFDVRHIVGPVVVQLRQGLDATVVVRGLRSGEHRTDLTVRLALYLGYQATETLAFGVEAWEVYRLTAEVDDSLRAAFAVSPSVRLNFPRVQPGLSLLLPIATPLGGQVDTYVAARLHADFVFPWDD